MLLWENSHVHGSRLAALHNPIMDLFPITAEPNILVIFMFGTHHTKTTNHKYIKEFNSS